MPNVDIFIKWLKGIVFDKEGWKNGWKKLKQRLKQGWNLFPSG